MLEKVKIIAQVNSLDTSFDTSLISQTNDSKSWINSFHLNHLTQKEVTPVKILLWKHEDVFSQSQLDLGRACGFKHHTNTGSAAPVNSRRSRYSPAERKIMER